MNVTEQENGRRVTVAQGDTLVVTLASNPTTGYEWRIAKDDPEHLKPLGKPEFIGPQNRRVGAGGKQVFRFQAQSPGTTVVELHYLRPFEKDKPPARTYRLTAQISPAAK
jgi:inhibitor of cysteine peptidase